jgi:hypothetical protein
MHKCECGREFPKANALQLHKKACNKSEGQQHVKCSHEWRFLNLRIAPENEAHKYGYKEVCQLCQELRQ